MCFSSPKAPIIQYVGPSQSDIDAQNQSLQMFMQQSAQQQQMFASTLQAQIDAANREAERQAASLAEQRASFDTGMKTEAQKASEEMLAAKQKAQLDMAAESAAAASQNAAQVQSSYGVNTAQITPVNAQVTEPIKPKKPERDSLKITPGSVETMSGTGINIGV